MLQKHELRRGAVDMLETLLYDTFATRWYMCDTWLTYKGHEMWYTESDRARTTRYERGDSEQDRKYI